MNRRIRASHAEQDLQSAFAQLTAAPHKHDMELLYRPFKRNRSHEQNARYWAILQNAAVQLGEDAETLHQRAKFKFLGYREIEHEGHTFVVVNSTTKLNTKQFTDYVDQVEAWLACEFGVTHEGVWYE